MTHMVTCVKMGREMEGLDEPPFDGALGQRIYENVSKLATKYGIQAKTYRGRGEFLGGDTREDGAKAYRQAIDGFEQAAGAGGGGAGLRGADLHAVRAAAEKGIGRHPVFSNVGDLPGHLFRGNQRPANA